MAPAPGTLATSTLRAPEQHPEAMEPEEVESAESGEEDQAPAAKKRRRKAGAGGILQPPKLSEAELYKAPTSEELSRLKETENLFHSSLLRLQMEELLKEVRVKEKKKQKIDAFLREVNQRLSAVPATPEVQMVDQTWLPPEVRVPFLQVPFPVKGRFRFLPPSRVTVVGSYLLGTCIRPEVNVDLALTMPQEILQDKDGLNQRYLRKRALYLAHLAHHLARDPLFGSVRFTYMNGCHLKPLLLLRPQGKDERLVTVRLYPCPPPGFFKPCRLLPNKNNVRTAWFLGKETPDRGSTTEPPTPNYNNLLLCDTAMEAHLQFLSAVAASPGLRDGVAVLKVWLRQRELDQGLGGFSGFLVSMLVSFLLATHKVSASMSGYQVLRSCLQFLATTDLTAQGISLCRSPDPALPALADFHQAFPVVFLDPSGRLNLCADMTTSTYRQVQHEARLSMAVLDDKSADGFQLLLMTPKPLIRTFDHVFHVRPLEKLQAACHRLELRAELQDRGGDYVATTLPLLTSLLTRGLGSRIRLLAHSRPQSPQWAVGEDPPKHKDHGSLAVGLLLCPEHVASVLEMGPEADQPEAAAFRQFWGPRSELRRFQDGTIREAVLWDTNSLGQKRLVPQQVVTHLLQLHTDIPESCIHYVGGLLDPLICVGKEPGATGEEELAAIVRSYDELSRQLWGLEGLPLAVTAVQGAHPALRYTDVFPPTPFWPSYAHHKRIVERKSLAPLAEKPCPAYVEPLTVLCHMEGSGQWPQDVAAVQRVRAAFQMRLAELLHQQHGLPCRPTATHTDVYKDGYVFRLRVAYHREPLLLRETLTPTGMVTLRDTPTSLRLELETELLPRLSSTLHGLQQQHLALGSTARLAKRWLSAQLLSDGLSEESVDLLVAWLFLHPAPFTVPSSPQVGFLRFLSLMATFDWKNSPLIVNLNGELADADYAEIRSGFLAARTQLPVMFIATPRDRDRSVWTQERPSAQILQRIMVLAAEALPVLEKQLMDPLGCGDVKTVFRPPLDGFDVLIHLESRQLPRHRQAVDKSAKSFYRGLRETKGPGGYFPVVGFDPAQSYLTELREAFGDLALFFHDRYGGEVIGVLWKPGSFQAQPFKAGSMQGRMVVAQSGELVTVPNVEAVLEDFAVLGEGLVRSMEVRSERWSI
ncbi:nucleolar protein 6 [Ornithorhynchus anatinus]|uniref:Nucleolar protein 6 n=1 Tax=Ornithorhynchus anatinus TaxID=9258 RepID=F6RNV1_ORNAN|nr:nucleolar protein 6 [Ornithorhynchus anatinus]